MVRKGTVGQEARAWDKENKKETKEVGENRVQYWAARLPVPAE